MRISYYQSKDVRERRISEKTQEIFLYCAQKKSSMTPRAFDRARSSLKTLLENIADRDPKYAGIPRTVIKSMEKQEECIAKCSSKQAENLATTIVSRGIPDDLDLYPISAEQKLNRSKARGLIECDIPIDEMTFKDKVFVVWASFNEKFSSKTFAAVRDWFKEVGLDINQARVYAALYFSESPLLINSLPQYILLRDEYRGAIKTMLEKGIVNKDQEGRFYLTEQCSGKHDTNTSASRISRIEAMEQCFDKVKQALERWERAQEEYRASHESIEKLKHYMDSGQWREDYEADERGELPASLKRGVLSEDALYNLLEECKE